MNILQKLFDDVTSHNSETRRNAIWVLGMVEETFALKLLAERYRQETDPEVKAALDWAGKRLIAAHKAGRSTFDSIYKFYGVYRHIENLEDPTEAQLEKQLQANLANEMARMRADAQRKQAIGAMVAAGAAIGAAAMGSIGGMGMGMGAMSPSFDTSSNLGAAREAISTKRTAAPRPTESSLGVWEKRLLEGSTPEVRAKAPKELALLNNPDALVPLAIAFANDEDEKVKSEAEQSGKVLYWGVVYFQMEQDGTLDMEMMRLAQSIGKVYIPDADD